MTDKERLDVKLASRCAQRDIHKPGTPHHHYRCDWVKGDWPGTHRCVLSADHAGDHVYEVK